jgi:hypothetical protein
MYIKKAKPSLLDIGVENFFRTYNQFGYDFDLVVARVFICSFMIWKLLSRDFGAFSYIPEEVFYFYPYQIYTVDKWILWTGIPFIQDVLTMHFIHWIFPHPNSWILQLVQIFSIALLVTLGVYGKGKRSIFLVTTYLALIYLWGYLILLGQEIDSVDLYFGMLLALMLGRYKDSPVWELKALYSEKPNLLAGRSRSLLMLVIVFYYFASGIKKITDLSVFEWFDYYLIEAIMHHGIVSNHSPHYRPDFFKIFNGHYYLNNILPPLVYLSHLCTPLVFFYRSMVFKFFVFYTLFHLMTFGVGISFTGYIVVWAAIFPWHDILSKFRNLK